MLEYSIAKQELLVCYPSYARGYGFYLKIVMVR